MSYGEDFSIISYQKQYDLLHSRNTSYVSIIVAEKTYA